MTDARKKELLQVATGWTGLAVLLSPLSTRVSDFCHRVAGKYYEKAYGQLSVETLIRITTLIESFREATRA